MDKTRILPMALVQLSFAVRRLPIRVKTIFRIMRLSARNHLLSPLSEGPGAGEPKLVVSLTSYGSRVSWVHLAIESIISSGAKAEDVFLWLPIGTRLGNPLQRLVGRGLNVRFVTDQRSHTKYCYLDQVPMSDESLGFLIADDDMVYPRNWYKDLLASAILDPKLPCVSYGAQAWVLDGSVSFTRPLSSSTHPKDLIDKLFHPFSGSGLFIPKSTLVHINKDPEVFMKVCPTNDDIWLHREFFRLGKPVRDLGDTSMPPSIPFNRSNGLFQINWHGGQNEIQIKEAFRGLI